MRKAILMMLLAAASSSAAAEWVAVGSSEPSTLYADLTTIRKAGDTVKMSDLLDFKTAQVTEGHRYLSSLTTSEYDCKGNRARILYFSWHSGNMGGGQIVNMDLDTSEWEPVRPRSGVETLWKFACKKR